LNEYATTTKFPLQVSNQSKIETIINLFFNPPHKQESSSHHKTTNQAATMQPRIKQPPCNQELSSHCATHNSSSHQETTLPTTKNPRIKHTHHHGTKNQAATTQPNVLESTTATK
jgi:hypothetical protein